jgi:hypothetical protein
MDDDRSSSRAQRAEILILIITENLASPFSLSFSFWFGFAALSWFFDETPV